MVFKKAISGKAINNLKIATYNVNSIRSRLHIVLPWMEKKQAGLFLPAENKS